MGWPGLGLPIEGNKTFLEALAISLPCGSTPLGQAAFEEVAPGPFFSPRKERSRSHHSLSQRRIPTSLGAILLIIIVICLLGGFSGRFGGYGYGFGNGGVGALGAILIVVAVLVLLGRI